MFWLKRLKFEEQGTSWEISFADLMSLLMGIFVLIATMSELRPGKRLDAVSGSMRNALGFSAEIPDFAAGSRNANQRASLIEHLRQAGLRRVGSLDDGTLNCCDVVSDADQIVIRVAGPAAFDALSAQLKPPAGNAVARIGEYLKGGQSQIEICGHNGDGVVPAHLSFRDGVELSYQRARGVADVLIRAGVSPERISVSAKGDTDPLPMNARGVLSDSANRRIEMIVHAVPAAQVQAIAEKEQQHG